MLLTHARREGIAAEEYQRIQMRITLDGCGKACSATDWLRFGHGLNVIDIVVVQYGQGFILALCHLEQLFSLLQLR